MAIKVSVINMKGGVGKSTLCTNLAWHFSAMSNWKKRVLVVDLDPQFNASQYLLGAHQYQSINQGVRSNRGVFLQGAPLFFPMCVGTDELKRAKKTLRRV
jgi:cellulose biosynthesis protein BcsQ